MKKVYFIITSIIIIALSMYSIINYKSIAQNMVNSTNEIDELFNDSAIKFEAISDVGESSKDYGNINEEGSLVINDNSEKGFFERINELLNEIEVDVDIDINLESYYQKTVVVFSIIIILMQSITIIIAKNNHILRYKVRLIVYSIFTFLLSSNGYVMLLAVMNFIVLLVLKRKDENDMPLPKKKISKLEDIPRTKKDIALGVLAIAIYIVLYVFLSKIISNYIDNNTLQIAIDLILNIIVYVSIAVIFKEELIKGITAIKNDFNNYRRFIVNRFIITLIITAFANFIRLIITKNAQSVNQSALEEIPIGYLAFLAIIWAPLVEECLFRGALFRFTKNKYIFIIVSGLVFGLLHALAEDGLFNVFVTALPYCVMGASFAMTYEKSNNIVTNIGMHALNNTIAVIAMYLYLY